MLHARQTMPAEEEQPDEGGLEEERHQSFDRQWGAEDVADVVCVVRPVGAELEFHGDAGCNTHGEVDAEQRAPEPYHVAPDGAAGGHINAFHDRQQH